MLSALLAVGAVAFSSGPFGIAAAAVNVLTAGAYIVSEFLRDDEPIEQFLRVCEWGKDPYDRALPHPYWSPFPTATWRDDFPEQHRVLIRMLHRIEVSWALFKHELVGLKVHFSALTPTSELEVDYFAVFVDGSVQRSTVHYGRDDLPEEVPAVLRVAMGPGIGRYGIPITLRAILRFRICEGFEDEIVEFPMKINGDYLSELPRTSLGNADYG